MTTQEVALRPTVNVQLQSSEHSLSEVVVTGYGVTRKVAFTGSASTVGNDVITKSTNADPIRALQGAATGFTIASTTGQPGAYNAVLIRGLGSMNSGTQPLYVIDGVPVSTGSFGMRSGEAATLNPLSNMNPNDIETISILKDATATSIYGSRASNGVVVITTKSGKAGKTKVSLTAKAGNAMIPARNSYRMLNTAEWYDFIGVMGKNTGWFDDGYSMDEVKEFVTSDDGLGLVAGPAGLDTDWYEAVTRTGVTQDYNIDISGGSEKTKFFLSGAYYDETGIVISKDMKRYSGRLNLSHEISSHVSLGLNASASFSNMNHGAGGGYFSDPITMAMMMLPIEPVYNEDGSWNMNTGTGYNPVAQRSEKGDKSSAKQYRATVSPWVKVAFLNNFTFLSRYGMDFYNAKEFGLWSMLQPQGNDMGMLGEEGNRYRTLWTWTNTLNYTKSFGSHNLNLLIGEETQFANDDDAYMSTSNYPTDAVYTLENGSVPGDAVTSITNYALASYFMNGEYDYADKYYLSASLRRDGSSRFGANNKWGTFWSAGLKYRLINESFMDATRDWLSNLTLRTSYGTTGNQDIGWYRARGLYGYGYKYANSPGMIPTQIANPDLRWEQTGKFNIGLEIGLLDFITLDLEYYNNVTSDMLFEVPLSRTTGFANIMQNVGEMQNTGVEAVLGVTPVKSSNFGWNFSLNLTHNKNKIVKLSTDMPIESTYTIREAGRPYYTFKMKEYAGVDPETGAQLWYKGEEGTETTTDYNAAGKRYLGEADPKLYGGFTNNIRAYDFDLSFQLNYSFGGKVYNSAARYDENINNPFGNTTEYVYENMWRKPGDQTTVPAPKYGNNTSHSSRFLMDGSYIKLYNIQLGYNIPKSILGKLSIEKVRLFVSGENLATWALGDDFRGLNPETAFDGVIWWNYPQARKLMFGLNLNF
jgi:TonB-linked SusC/RagA family outer membrane protein